METDRYRDIIERDDSPEIRSSIEELAGLGNPWFVALRENIIGEPDMEGLWGAGGRTIVHFRRANDEEIFQHKDDIALLRKMIEEKTGHQVEDIQIYAHPDIHEGRAAAEIGADIEAFHHEDRHTVMKQGYVNTYIFLPDPGESINPHFIFSYLFIRERLKGNDRVLRFTDDFVEKELYDREVKGIIVIPSKEEDEEGWGYSSHLIPSEA